jgi:hypothetical protein
MRCPRRATDREVARMRLQPQREINVAIATRLYICERCGTAVHIDMDWPEGATVEPDARLD